MFVSTRDITKKFKKFTLMVRLTTVKKNKPQNRVILIKSHNFIVTKNKKLGFDAYFALSFLRLKYYRSMFLALKRKSRFSAISRYIVFA